MIGELTKEQIEMVLAQGILGRLACCLNNKPYIVPISYGYNEGNIYARADEGLKLDIMRQNPHVCFQVDSTENLGNWRSVVAWGFYKELLKPEERRKAFNVLVKRELPIQHSSTMHLGTTYPFSDDNSFEEIDHVFFCICLHEKTGRFEINNEENDAKYFLKKSEN